MSAPATLRKSHVTPKTSQAGIFVQRKCDCGSGKKPLQDMCSECRTRQLQTKLTVGASSDPLEAEADRVADQVLASATKPRVSETPPRIQRVSHNTSTSATPVPAQASRTLESQGAPLDRGIRHEMEQRFSRDFSAVRIHNDQNAHDSATAINARAYTSGTHIVFGKNQYRPEQTTGKRLLAHELVHVVQQGYSPRGTIQRDENKKQAETSPSSPWKTNEQICDRESRENINFPSTYISNVNVDLTGQTLSLVWANAGGLTLPTGPFEISAGAGKCCMNCDDETTSQTEGSLCTPKGTWRVHNKSCVLSDTAWARNPTYFSRAGIAIHAGPRPGFPASHGCVRTEEPASEIIHDNTVYSARYAADEARGLPDRRSQISVTGTWNGSHCYPSSTAGRVRRADRCGSSGGGASQGSAPRKEGEAAQALATHGSTERSIDGPGPA